MSAQTFTYRARSASGEVVSGTIVAESAGDVSSKLRADGKFLVALDAGRGATLDAAQVRRGEAAKRVRRDDVIAFCEQLSVMLETGVPLAEALDAFHAQTRSREFRSVLEVVRDDIYGGETFSEATSKWPTVFPKVMTSLLRASEASGTLSLMLGRVGEYLGKERRTVRQIKGALSYPAFMIGASVLLSLFLMIFILPRFATIYEGKDAALPGMTKALLGFSEFLIGQWMVYVPICLGLLLAAFIGSRTSGGRQVLDWVRLNTPIVGPMFAKVYITRAARTMATLVSAGVNVLDIISICRDVTNNVVFDRMWTQMENEVRDGGSLSAAVERSRYIPPNVASMIASGERSGRLGDVMERVASFSEQELDNSVRQVTSLIEPIMVITMGGIVGSIAIALLLPIFRMGSVMSGG